MDFHFFTINWWISLEHEKCPHLNHKHMRNFKTTLSSKFHFAYKIEAPSSNIFWYRMREKKYKEFPLRPLNLLSPLHPQWNQLLGKSTINRLRSRNFGGNNIFISVCSPISHMFSHSGVRHPFIARGTLRSKFFSPDEIDFRCTHLCYLLSFTYTTEMAMIPHSSWLFFQPFTHLRRNNIVT